MPNNDEKYRLWVATTAFRKNGTPVMGTLGSHAQRVVVMPLETFRRLVKEPGLAETVWELGDLDA